MKLEDLFIIEYPKTLIRSDQIEDSNGVNFVSSAGTNNGVVTRIKRDKRNKMYDEGLITVPLKGTVLSAFVQPENFYVAHQIAVLKPKKPMTLDKKLYYCLCIKSNSYKYNFGRQADKTLSVLELPDKIPNYVNDKLVTKKYAKKPIRNKQINFKEKKWLEFKYSELFNIEKGKRLVNDDVVDGDIPFIRAISKNNGVDKWIDIKPNHSGNTITINYDGSVGESFYQPKSHFSVDSINILYPKKFKLNVYVAMFLITLIKLKKKIYNYGYKWNKKRMLSSTIKLPVDQDNEPDWKFMEEYVKSLPYSRNLEILN